MFPFSSFNIQSTVYCFIFCLDNIITMQHIKSDIRILKGLIFWKSKESENDKSRELTCDSYFAIFHSKLCDKDYTLSHIRQCDSKLCAKLYKVVTRKLCTVCSV